MINLPDIFENVIDIENEAELDIDHMNINFYKNGATNLYELAICEQNKIVNRDVYLLSHGIRPYL